MQVLWKGLEAMGAALELLEVATAFQNRTRPDLEPISWAQSFLRPAANTKQAQDFSSIESVTDTSQQADMQQVGSVNGIARCEGSASSSLDNGDSSAQEAVSVRAISLEEAAQRVPGLPSEQLRAALGPELAASAALLIEGAHVIHPTRYLRYLTCEECSDVLNVLSFTCLETGRCADFPCMDDGCWPTALERGHFLQDCAVLS